ncbi:GUN4 domain-containing protein [Oscillatoria sp. FACHB-1407]|uniref:GUN4 domain-containing protein n=1 Tax=Oscillatoria sp. FACHB-1407 TaxID=2692847 RepID=UPI0016899127|nr:GUN4 domain-containing protein [Oscillatoria sp. FACHB-1407]MBD2460254.1 GUN4 domain-containing protein [Oscillatoria sp. FACHB-1407]
MISPSESPEDFTTVDCTQLEKYLKGGLWRMADMETRKLIITACGGNPADPQTTPSLNQLPCPDLQKIDQLWVKYSRGRFGFSVQQAIWKPLEQKLYSKTDVWAAFGDRTSWRINHLLKQNYWKQHKELTFDIKAPAGHLPHMGDKFGILTLEQFFKQMEWCAGNPPAE